MSPAIGHRGCWVLSSLPVTHQFKRFRAGLQSSFRLFGVSIKKTSRILLSTIRRVAVRLWIESFLQLRNGLLRYQRDVGGQGLRIVRAIHEDPRKIKLAQMETKS